ncbi:STAS domain-containing protein [Streptomyces desertarenae]|uniref:STAS domain-containing protein n=1 Tax=Streptomyces desertarenae TaxID=2666184 RepID=A0ABW4PJF6_9ACTN
MGVVAASEPYGPLWYLSIRGEVDFTTVEQVSAAVRTMLRVHQGPVAVDTADLVFGDCQLLGVFIGVAAQRPTALVAPPPSLVRLIEVTGAGKLLPSFPTLRQARAYLAAGA